VGYPFPPPRLSTQTRKRKKSQKQEVMEIEITEETNIDYKVLLKETLLKLVGATEASDHPQAEYLNNLALTAIDYSFYLEDNSKQYQVRKGK
jgi:hypothetical protein